MTPYYEHAGITIYHGDCRDIVPSLTADVLITDPPYGVELGTSDPRGHNHGLSKAPYASYDDTLDKFRAIVVPAVTVALRKCVRGAVFSGPHIMAWPEPSVVGGIYCPSASGHNQWGFTNLFVVLFYGHDPRLNLGPRHTVLVSNETAERNGHPCPKPIGWMRWLVSRVAQRGECVLDPFMGSGTTLVAAKNLECCAIGIEIEERYCEIAAKRLSQEVLDFAGAERREVER